MLSKYVASFLKLLFQAYSFHTVTGNSPYGVRYDFDEMERWVKRHEREAVYWRQKVLGDRIADVAQGTSTWSGGSVDAPEPQRPESEVSTTLWGPLFTTHCCCSCLAE